MGKLYKSPTDMGVNMAGYCITNDNVCSQAAKQEIIRRYYATACSYRQGMSEMSEVYKVELLMNKAGTFPKDRPVVESALRRAKETGGPAMAMQLPDGQIVSGKTSSLLGASSACLLNALKRLGGIDKDALLISLRLSSQSKSKVHHMGNRNPRLHTDEVLIALAICAVTDPLAALAIEQLPRLSGYEAHSTVILSRVDENVLQKLGVNLTCEPKYQTQKLYRK